MSKICAKLIGAGKAGEEEKDSAPQLINESRQRLESSPGLRPGLINVLEGCLDFDFF